MVQMSWQEAKVFGPIVSTAASKDPYTKSCETLGSVEPILGRCAPGHDFESSGGFCSRIEFRSRMEFRQEIRLRTEPAPQPVGLRTSVS